MKLFYCEYFSLCFSEEAVVIAENEKEARRLLIEEKGWSNCNIHPITINKMKSQILVSTRNEAII